MSSDIMKYVGGAMPSSPRVPQVNLLASVMSVPTTARSVECDWTGYDMILVEAMFYSNVVGSVIFPVDYFAGTSTSRKAIVEDALNSRRYGVYQDGTGRVYVEGSASAGANYGVWIYGVLFGE